MKKLIALAFVGAFALALVACGGGAKQEEAAKEDTVATAPADTTAMDTTMADTTAAK
jgi:ABC-type glycerol-3-phosphate transport system substrate-binding protein